MDALDVTGGHATAAVEGLAEVEGDVARDAEEVGLAWKVWARSALRSSAFEGMQPTLRQTPPQFSSTIATDSPSCAPRTAATYPPGPAPRMTRS
ncbi:hypothetical protein HR12_42775 [Microbacterium sp. SUBG005]|nr:hypothetical protein HR12_42775 [Microbacterium sp. SUBG005]